VVPVKRVICVNGKHLGWFVRNVDGTSGGIVSGNLMSKMERKVFDLCCLVLSTSVGENGSFPTDEQMFKAMAQIAISSSALTTLFSWPDRALADAFVVPISLIQMRRESLVLSEGARSLACGEA
jgi:hypothetical protein